MILVPQLMLHFLATCLICFTGLTILTEDVPANFANSFCISCDFPGLFGHGNLFSDTSFSRLRI